eukprot:scaffold228228_cov14-Tisochrysis_lutea.AAC.1
MYQDWNNTRVTREDGLRRLYTARESNLGRYREDQHGPCARMTRNENGDIAANARQGISDLNHRLRKLEKEGVKGNWKRGKKHDYRRSR